jgi:hypothetical protein
MCFSEYHVCCQHCFGNYADDDNLLCFAVHFIIFDVFSSLVRVSAQLLHNSTAEEVRANIAAKNCLNNLLRYVNEFIYFISLFDPGYCFWGLLAGNVRSVFLQSNKNTVLLACVWVRSLLTD